MAIKMEPKEVVREIRRRLADTNDDLADRVAAAKLALRRVEPDPEYGRHNLVERLLQERDQPAASPSLPNDAPSPKIKASPNDAKKKRPVTIRIDPDIVEFFQKDGPGWQTRMNEVLRKAIE